MAENRQFFSIPEAAALLGVSRIAIFKKVKKGQLAGIRIGRNWAIPAQAVTAPGPERSPKPAAAAAADVRPPPPPAMAHRAPAPARETPPETDPMDEMGWD